MGQQEASPAAHVLFIHSPRRAWPMFPAALDARGSMQLLSLAHRERDKGLLFLLQAPGTRLQHHPAGLCLPQQPREPQNQGGEGARRALLGWSW